MQNVTNSQMFSIRATEVLLDATIGFPLTWLPVDDAAPLHFVTTEATTHVLVPRDGALLRVVAAPRTDLRPLGDGLCESAVATSSLASGVVLSHDEAIGARAHVQLGVDACWLAHLQQALGEWRRDPGTALQRQLFADGVIDLTLAECLLQQARAAPLRERLVHARRSRQWIVRCVKRLITVVDARAWLGDAAELLRCAERGLA
jgi:hypothetical protein